MLWLTLPIVLWIVLPLYRHLKIYSIYEYLELRFDAKTHVIGSVVFIFWRMIWLGGVVTNTTVFIGLLGGSVGTVTITGEGSGWNNSELLAVGYEGEGTLNIGDGGVVNVAGTTYLINSTLHIELSDPTSGPSLITDSLELDGTLGISLANGFLLELGSTFDILDFNTVSGGFAEMNLPELGGGQYCHWGQVKAT